MDTNQTLRDVSDEREIRAWLIDQGLGHLIADNGTAAQESSNNRTTNRGTTMDVTENQDIQHWLQQQGLGHLIKTIQDKGGSAMPSNGSQLPVHYPELITDDFHPYAQSGGSMAIDGGDNYNDGQQPMRRRSLSSGISFPSNDQMNTLGGYDDGRRLIDVNGIIYDGRDVDEMASPQSRRRRVSVGSISELHQRHPGKIVVRQLQPAHRSSSNGHFNGSADEYLTDNDGLLNRRLHRAKDETFKSEFSPQRNHESSESESNEIIKVTAPHHSRRRKASRSKLSDHSSSEEEEYDEKGNLIHKQRVFVRYLQPPTPPADGPIIIKETPMKPHHQPSPIIIRQTYPSPPTPLPIIYREQAPPQPKPEPTTIIKKHVPAPPPPRQIIIEKVPPPPQKHPDIIIEKWLPPKQPKRREVIIHQCEPQAIATTPTITVIEPPPQQTQVCKSNIKYIKHIYDQSPTQPIQLCSNVCPTACPSAVMTCLPAGCMNPATIICQQGQPGVIIPAVMAPPGFYGAMNYGTTGMTSQFQPGAYGQIGREYIPTERDSVQNVWRSLQGPAHNQSNPGSAGGGIGSEYIPKEGDAVRGIWNALQGSSGPGRPTSAPSGGIGSEYIPKEGDAVRGIWNALQGGQQTSAPTGGIGSEYIPKEGDAVRGMWNALQGSGGGAQARTSPAGASRGTFQGIGSEYIPQEGDAVRGVWNALQGSGSTGGGGFGGPGFSGVGSEYIPRESDAVQGVWNALQGSTQRDPFSTGQMGQIGQQFIPTENRAVFDAWNAMNRQNMPFTGLLESYVKRRFQGVR